MNVRTKLTLRFIFITSVIFLLASVLIYLFSADYRRKDFYSRLNNKAVNTAKLLIEVDEVDATLLRRIEQDNPVSLPKEKIIIYNYRDTVLFSTDESGEIQVTPDLLDQIRLDDEVRFKQGRYEVLGFLFKGQYDRFVVIAAATDIYGFKRLRNLVYILLVVFAFSILVVSISGWIYAGRALQPIARIVNSVAEISAASLDRRLDEGNGKDEISLLAQTFNSMIARLETSFMTQKNFISNASHELRTPLTSLTGHLEVALLSTRSPLEYRKVIQSALEDIRDLNNLSNRLLLLAQTSSEEKQRSLVNIRVDDLLWQLKDDVSKRNAGFQIHIQLDEAIDDESALTIKGDEQLMRTALLNVLENGCKYSPDRTTKVQLGTKDRKLIVSFTDRGIGILPEDLPNIFQPFYRGSNTKNVQGHGIGLSMVKGIIKIHSGSIHIESRPGEGTTVSITLPTAS